ncbi:hypothetical protein ABZS66_18665 [Dactylosporangium sp. NPDC005572]|uniref:hypothetical protein n=1 Tax=Dactylosporangium sp. NPDC005572 TaxID=3156889 RepID=UPI0033AD1022
MSDIDRVVGALLTAMATLEDLAELYSHEHMAINALEGIAYQLGQMSDEERRDFDAAISRIADARDKDEAGTGEWIRNVLRSLGLP